MPDVEAEAEGEGGFREKSVHTQKRAAQGIPRSRHTALTTDPWGSHQPRRVAGRAPRPNPEMEYDSNAKRHTTMLASDSGSSMSSAADTKRERPERPEAMEKKARCLGNAAISKWRSGPAAPASESPRPRPCAQ